ncbi:MAG TPA: hypothetical protein VGN42_12065 [Pirellulales bacterium]|jgi:hypothetical protein|nr:hypothetical protein [Pirellulales bacterium]
MKIPAARILPMVAVCLLAASFGCRQMQANRGAPMKTPPQGLPAMKRINSVGASQAHPELF